MSKKQAKALVRKYDALVGVHQNWRKCFALYYYIDGWMGVPYKYGGTSKKGVDCSGFTGNLYKQVYKTNIPRSSKDQYTSSHHIRRKRRLRQGNLVFFHFEGSNKVSHVGVYLTNGKFVHASTSKGVTISDIKDAYYTKGYVCGGRVDTTHTANAAAKK